MIVCTTRFNAKFDSLTVGAGSGMASMRHTNWNLVWRRHTSLLKFGQLVSGKSLKLLPPDVRF